MTWVGTFFASSDELFNGGLEGYFTLNVGTGGGAPTQVTANTSVQVNFTHPSFLARIIFTGTGLSVGSTTLPNGTSLPILTSGTVTHIDFLYNYRLSDAINNGVSAPELMQAAFLEPSASIDIVGGLSAQALTASITQSYASGSVQPFINFLSQDRANFSGTNGVNLINGFNGDDVLVGLGGNDALSGNGGNDILDGGFGTDVMNGGEGSDLYLPGPPDPTTPTGDSISDSGTANPNDIDTISYENATGPVIVDLYLQDGNQSAGWARGLMAGGIERVIGSAFDDTLIGTDFPESVNDTAADILEGGDGDDTLVGLGGSDILQGGPGFDILVGGANGDIANPGPGDTARFNARLADLDVFFPGDGSVLVAAPGGGVDQLFEIEFIGTLDGVFNIGSFGASSKDLQIGDDNGNPINGNNRDSLLYGRGGDDVIGGGGGRDRLEGGDGDDTLDGGIGADVMVGEAGDDDFFVDDAGDQVVEKAGEGYDTVRSTVSFSLGGQHIERLFLMGNSAINGTGNNLANRLFGNGASNTLDGKGGADVMFGYGGNDNYVVDDVGDVVREAAGEGYDTVRSTVSFSLGGQHIERLFLKGNASINGTGNSLANKMFGNDASNTLDGKGGADVMFGYGGDDDYVVDDIGDVVREAAGEGYDTVRSTVSFSLGGQHIERLFLKGTAAINGTGNSLANKLFGNDASNTLDGKGGADVMFGYGGDDNYVVDDVGDVVREAAGEGYDTVRSTVSFSLEGEHIERLFLKGTAAINGTGNSLANKLFGNDASNTLDGKGGADVMLGYGGDDNYVVDDVGDVVREAAGEGYDTVRSTVSFSLVGEHIERLILKGNSAIDGTGNNLDNRIVGNSKANVLAGRGGDDEMTGGGGRDRFVFDFALGADNIDTITDFKVDVDTIVLSGQIFTAIGSTLNGSEFRANSTGLARDGNDHVIYDRTTGALFYDPDGSGGQQAVQFARLSSGLALSHSDFDIV
jgi:RTX toxins and related Ca2+-binding proteins